MEMIANNLFYDRDDVGDLLARYRMLWLDYGARLERLQPRLPPAEMLREAAGIGLDEMITLGFLYEDFYNSHRPHRALNQAAPLRPLPDGVTDLDHFRVRRRDRAGGVIHEYRLMA